MKLEALKRNADTPGWQAIHRERERQRTAHHLGGEGWGVHHDASHPTGTLALAGRLYKETQGPGAPEPSDWPWASEWWKPRDRRRNLERAGALFLAEADRCHYALHRPIALHDLATHLDFLVEQIGYCLAMAGMCAYELDHLDES